MGWRSETIRVDVLVRREPRPWITRDERVELDVGRAQNRDAADVETVGLVPGALWIAIDAVERRGRDLRAVEIHPKALAAVARQIGAALELGDAGELPAVKELGGQLALAGVGQVDVVRGVEDVGTVAGQHAIVVVQVELVVEAHDTHSFAVGIVQVDIVPALGTQPRHLKRVVVRIPVIAGDVQVRIAQERTELVGDEFVRVRTTILRRQHRPHRNHVDVQCVETLTTAVAGTRDIARSVANVGDLQQARPWCPLRNREVIEIRVRLLVVFAVHRRGTRRHGAEIQRVQFGGQQRF